MADLATGSRPPAADLLCTIALAGAVVILMAAGAPDAIRVVPAVPLVLYGSGYAVSAALFPPGRIDVVLRVAIALGLSLASAIFGAVLLDAAGVPLTSWTLIGWTADVTAVGFAVAAWRRRGDAAHAPSKWRASSWARVFTALAAAYIVAAVGVGVALASEIPRAQGFPGYSTLSVRDLGMNKVRLGVRSDETRTTEYRCTVTLAGRPIRAFLISLAPGEEWAAELTLRQVRPNADVLEARLLRTSTPDVVYRRVNISLGRP